MTSSLGGKRLLLFFVVNGMIDPPSGDVRPPNGLHNATDFELTAIVSEQEALTPLENAAPHWLPPTSPRKLADRRTNPTRP